MLSNESEILVVDDIEDNRYTLERRLKRDGYENITLVDGGAAALELISERQFDLILLDLMMPEISGLDVLKNLKSEKSTKWVWVEVKNMDGQPGWLYGDANFIVFELSDSFLFVERKSLINHIHSNIDFSLPLVQNTWEAKYKLYQRKGKLDQIAQVKVSSLLSLSEFRSFNGSISCCSMAVSYTHLTLPTKRIV